VADLLTADIADAVQALRAGGLVALPTETVYGLAADAENATAVRRIYSVKGRPTDHPVIVHLATPAAIEDWAAAVPEWAEPLIAACWPGPLTLVLSRTARASDYVTGGQDTVGLRVPAHPLMQQVLAEFGGAVAAPSANRFGQISPTTAAHVLAELDGVLDPVTDRILDGGPCLVGVESTIVDATGGQPRILRPGKVTADQIEQLTGLRPSTVAGSMRAPGTLSTHYAPKAAVVLSEADMAQTTFKQLRDGHSVRIGVISLKGDEFDGDYTTLSSPTDVAEYAHSLYDALRRADDLRMDIVLAVLPPETGMGTAVRDRLQRAASRDDKAAR
jgi:L-threonylcarbamoyladenylate synthase